MNEVFQTKIEEFISHQKNLISKTQTHLNEAKEEYLKVLDLVRNKDLEIEQLRTNNEHQKDLVQSLEERLLSIVVLEYKIKNLDQEHTKKVEKVKNECQRQVEKLVEKGKYLTKGTMEEAQKMIEMRNKENKINEMKIKRLEKEKEHIKHRFSGVLESSRKELEDKSKLIENLKGNLSSFQKKQLLAKG